MHLTLDGARADRAPAHQIREKLPEGRVEEFGARGKAEIGEIGEKLPGKTEPFVDVIGPVQVWIIDKPFPSDDGSRLFEVHAHDDEDSILDPGRERSQSLRIVERGPGVVDRAGTDDRKEASVAPIENGFDRSPRARYAFAAAGRDRNLL